MPSDTPDRLRYVGATPDNLATGRPLAPGDYISGDDLTTDEDGRLDPNDARLLDEGLLIDGEVVPQDPDEPQLAGQALDDALKARGLPTTGSADEKRDRVAQFDAENPDWTEGGTPA